MGPNDIQQCFQDPQSTLASAAETKNMQQFKSALLNGADPDLIDRTTNISILHSLCKDPRSRPFIEECIKNGSDVMKPNKYGKCAIHFAAESLDPDNLQAVISAVKFQSENLNVKAYNMTALMQIATNLKPVNLQSSVQCIRLLIENGADVNIPDHKEQTLILMLLKNLVLNEDLIKNLLEYILSTCKVDLDTFRKGEARKLLKEKLPELENFVQTGLELSIDVLMKYLRSGHEKEFTSGLKRFMTAKGYKTIEDIEGESVSDMTLLEGAVVNNRPEIVKYLLSLGANPNRFKKGTMPCLQLAAQRNLPEVMEELLKCPNIQVAKDSTSKSDPILCTIIKQLGDNIENAEPYQRCFDLLINHDDIDVNEKDNVTGNTALHFACRYRNRYVMRKLLEKNAYIGIKNIFESLAMDDIDPKVLEEYFDSCIQTNHFRLGNDDFELTADYGCLVPPKLKAIKGKQYNEEMLPIVYMARCKELKHLMTHPLITSFMFIKWHRLFSMFLLNLVLYSIFCASLIVYVVFFYGKNYEHTAFARLFALLTVAGIVFLLVREALQALLNPYSYTKHLINYLELALIFMTIVVLSTSPASYNEFGNMHRFFASVTILLAAAELSLLISSLPNSFISTHIVMLKRVSSSFLKSLSINSVILLAFAFCFYTLFNGPTGDKPQNSTVNNNEEKADEFNRFIDPGTAIIKTIVMLTGEFEAASIDFDVNATSYFVFLMFLFFMSIVLFNLLNGLAVSDTQAIKAEAEECHFSEKAFTLHRFERSVLTKRMFEMGPASGLVQRFINLICVFPEFLPQHKIIVAPNQNHNILIPTHKNSIDSNGTETMVLVESNIERKELSEFASKFCCLGPCYGKCSRMDRKIVKRMMQIVLKREQDRLEERDKVSIEQRLSKIEQNIEKIFEKMSELTKTK